MIREDAKPDRYGLIDRDGNEIRPNSGMLACVHLAFDGQFPTPIPAFYEF